jgi:predicted flap endonuclease-1-like 5' DNA nuclease
VEKGIITSVDPLSATVSRATAAPLYLGIAYYYWGSGSIDAAMKSITTTCTFSDVRSESQIADACKLGILRGMENGRFYPQNNLTPAQAMVTLMRTIAGRQDESVTPWWSNYMSLATKHGIVPESDRIVIASGTTITREKILSWIYNASISSTLKSDPAVARASTSMFASAEFLGQPKPTTSVQPAASPVVAVMPTKDVAPLPKMDMSMKSDKKYSMSYGRDCDTGMLLCRWFGFDGNSWFGWIWFLLAVALVWWILWNLWKWLCSCMWGNGKKYKNHDVYTAHKGQKMNMTAASVKTVKNTVTKPVAKKWKTAAVVWAKKDDLKIVEGIGPKVEKLLHDAWVYTFADLAKMTPAGIKKILTPHGSPYSAMTTDTWPRQSGLARDGKMKELETLKEKLNGGKIV